MDIICSNRDLHRLRRAAGVLVLMLAANAAQAATSMSVKPVLLKDAAGRNIAFPDVCKTPAPPAGPVPIPYPNIVDRKKSDFGAGRKKTKTGGQIEFKRGHFKNKRGSNTALVITVRDRTGRPRTFDKSTLLELQDGSYCAICVAKGRVTRVIRLLPKQGLPKQQTPLPAPAQRNADEQQIQDKRSEMEQESAQDAETEAKESTRSTKEQRNKALRILRDQNDLERQNLRSITQ